MYVLLDDQKTHRQLWFTDPVRVLIHRAGEPVGPLFEAIEKAQSEGLWVAGIFHYEFGASLEPKLGDIVAAGVETVRLGVFEAPCDHPPANLLYRAAPPEVSLSPDWTQDDYVARFEAVQRHLRAGDAYQVNLTFPMRGTTDATAAALHAGFRRRQPGRYGAVVSLGGPDIVSFSPELFFERRGAEMRMRPMKGTRPKDAADDMREDDKSRAENLMIVDLLRNDLSRLCEPGSVKVPELFAVEDYPTLVQMTSQVTGRLRGAVGWEAIFRALFPCGSVTGAPKIRAMEIIHELEAGPRGAYCGSVGFIAPDGDAAFSVAIRTAVLEDGNLRYDVGSGVVLDSDGADEYAECLLKSAVFDAPSEAAVETLRGDASGVFVRRDRHAQRLSDARPGASLDDALSSLPETGAPQRVRVAVSADGTVDLQSQSLEALPEPLTLALSRYALTPAVQRTDIKTSRRDFYDGERARVSALCGADEVLFRNEDGLMMEGSFTTLFVQSGGRLLTPRTPGLLPGVLRAEMLERGLASEADITLPVLLASEAVYVGNSLRGLIRAELSGPDPV